MPPRTSEKILPKYDGDGDDIPEHNNFQISNIHKSYHLEQVSVKSFSQSVLSHDK